MPYDIRIPYIKIDFQLPGNLTNDSISLDTVQFPIKKNHLFLDVSSKIVSMIRKYHNRKLQINPWHREEEHTTITRHQQDKVSKATSSLFPIKMIEKLEWI